MELPKRKPNRIKGYDYSQNGAYFITICTKNNRHLFWDAGAHPVEYRTEGSQHQISDAGAHPVEYCAKDSLHQIRDAGAHPQEYCAKDSLHQTSDAGAHPAECRTEDSLHQIRDAGARSEEYRTKDSLHQTSDVGARIARPKEYTYSLSACGRVVDTAIQSIPQHYPMIAVDKYVIMPNHVHLLLIVQCGESGRAMRAPTISTVINQMKGYVTKQVGFSCWQKLFHDRVIRDERDYLAICQYIDTNPQTWHDDALHPNGKTDTLEERA